MIRLIVFIFVAVWFPVLVGCSMRSRGWEPSDYFDDSNVVSVCTAIRRNKISDVERLLSEGVDVNVKGRGNMTLLAWALRHSRLEIFELLLQKGADPNAKFQRDFGHPFENKGSVTHVSARLQYEYFELVMKHGGDANLKGMKYDASPMHTVIRFGGQRKVDRIRLLIDKGADLEYADELGETALLEAISWGGQYGIALTLLDSGADPLTYRVGNIENAVHFALGESRRARSWTPQQASDYSVLMRRLAELDCPIEEAKADRARWAAWAPHQIGEKRKEELQRLQQNQAKQENE